MSTTPSRVPQPESEEEYLHRIARETGEDIRDVRDVFEALKSCAAEEEEESEDGV